LFYQIINNSTIPIVILFLLLFSFSSSTVYFQIPCHYDEFTSKPNSSVTPVRSLTSTAQFSIFALPLHCPLYLVRRRCHYRCFTCLFWCWEHHFFRIV